MVTKIDMVNFVIEVENGRNVIDCGKCGSYPEFVEIVKALRKNGKIDEKCEIVI